MKPNSGNLGEGRWGQQKKTGGWMVVVGACVWGDEIALQHYMQKSAVQHDKQEP